MSGAISSQPNVPKSPTGTGAAALYYQDSGFAATSSVTSTYTVIGHTDTNTPLTADEVIVSQVSLSDFNKCLAFHGQWSPPVENHPGGPTYPKVVFAPSMLVAGMSLTAGQTAEARFVESGLSGATPTFADDGGDSSLWTVQAYFNNETFSAPATTKEIDLMSIPVEAISNVAVGTLSTMPLSTVLTAQVNSAGGSSSEVDYAQELFKQAVAAGKVTSSGAAGVGGADPVTANDTFASMTGLTLDGGGVWYKPNWVVGDSITIYVTYTLSKTAAFVRESVGAAGGASSIVLNGATYILTATGSDNKVETSVPVVIAYQFVAIA